MKCRRCQSELEDGAQFCGQCGQPVERSKPSQDFDPAGLEHSWRVVVQSGPATGQSFRLGIYTRLGRGPENDVQILDAQSSRNHAVIRRTDDGKDGRMTSYVIVDRQSTNGTFINGRRVQQQTPLQLGDSLVIGNTQLAVLAAAGSCQNCGVPLDPTDSFCRNCGHPVSAERRIPSPVMAAEPQPVRLPRAAGAASQTGSLAEKNTTGSGRSPLINGLPAGSDRRTWVWGCVILLVLGLCSSIVALSVFLVVSGRISL